MAVNPFKPSPTKATFSRPEHQSAGIYEDFNVEKVGWSREIYGNKISGQSIFSKGIISGATIVSTGRLSGAHIISGAISGSSLYSSGTVSGANVYGSTAVWSKNVVANHISASILISAAKIFGSTWISAAQVWANGVQLTGAAGSQTPWTQGIDANNFGLSGASCISAARIYATGNISGSYLNSEAAYNPYGQIQTKITGNATPVLGLGREIVFSDGTNNFDVWIDRRTTETLEIDSSYVGGNLWATGMISAANLYSRNQISGARLYTSAAVQAAGGLSGSHVISTGAISGAWLYTAGKISAATLYATTSISGAQIWSAGNISGANLYTANMISGANVYASTGIYAPNIVANHISASNLISAARVFGSSGISGASVWANNHNISEPFPIGAVFLSVVSTNPATLLGYGTWSAIAAGKMLVGLDSGDVDFDTAEETGGAKTYDLSHAHTITHNGHNAGSTVEAAGLAPVQVNDGAADSQAMDTQGSSTQSVLNPYFVVYVWKRTA